MTTLRPSPALPLPPRPACRPGSSGLRPASLLAALALLLVALVALPSAADAQSSLQSTEDDPYGFDRGEVRWIDEGDEGWDDDRYDDDRYETDRYGDDRYDRRDDRGRVERMGSTSRYVYRLERPVCLSADRGSRCSGDQAIGSELRIDLGELSGARGDEVLIERIRLEAHDGIGNYHRGGLAVEVDGRRLHRDQYLDIESQRSTRSLELDDLRGSVLTFREVRRDEVVISGLEIEFIPRRQASLVRPNRPGDDRYGDRYDDRVDDRYDDDRWGRADEELTDPVCIGGERCSRRALTVSLDRRPVTEIRIWAHDDVGRRNGGLLQVAVDDTVVGDRLEVDREGEEIILRGPAITGRSLTLTADSDDEVVIEELVVIYESGASRTYLRRR